ncbi:MAG: 50S ribosomal protein L9 [Pseudomonadota bacterium]
MNVILLDKVPNLGALGELVSVKPGYARNFLIPQGKAVFASKQNVAEFEQKRADWERQALEKQQAAETRKAHLDALPNGVTIAHKVGEEGKLFGSVGIKDIIAACGQIGITLERNEVRLPEGPFRLVGDYAVTVHLYTDVETTLPVHVVAA